MKPLHLSLCAIAGFGLLAAAPAQAAAVPESAKIDEILAKSWEKQGLKPNPPAPDDVFLRRIYLDVVGRVPTVAEAEEFLRSTDPQKRMKLIDTLLASDGYVSNYFNYYADILRLQTDTKGQLTGYAYADWLKAALKKNQHWDSMVRELLTTDGAAWDSGAIGYYMRDMGMALDNLAATVQIFLGTQIVCAQCHNHPFDKWTQKEYYEMAAYTYGMDTRSSYGLDFKGMDRKKLKGEDAKQMREDMQDVRRVVSDVTKTLRYTSIKETDKLPKLPHDYKYTDAKPNDTVPPKTMFGHEAAPESGESRLGAFARWMTAPENPRFTTVIANRLWKKVMGLGLIEPVDEMMDSTTPSNGELMTYLEQLMIQKDYNLKSYLRVLLNSDVYQRMANTQEVALGDTYYFTGPLLRRMSAEQVWDSVVTLTRGNIDHDAAAPNEAAERRLATLEKLSDALTSQDPKKLIESLKEVSADREESDAKIKELTAKMTEARRTDDTVTARQLSSQINRLRNDDRDSAFVAILGEEGAREFQREYRQGGLNKAAASKKNAPASPSREEVEKLMKQGLDKKEIRKRIDELRKQQRGSGSIAGMARASDLPSPAPRGHFLRTFGQSDRETIENASKEGTVPQALNLLNGPVAAALMAPGSEFMSALEVCSTDAERMDTIYLALLSRYPTNNEKQALMQVARERGEDAVADVTHALLNTSQFLFVQ